MIHRFIEAWSHSRFERTGIDELLMGLTFPLLIGVGALVLWLFTITTRRILYWRTWNTPIKNRQEWTDGKITYHVEEFNEDSIWIRQSNAFSFKRLYGKKEWRDEIKRLKLYTI